MAFCKTCMDFVFPGLSELREMNCDKESLRIIVKGCKQPHRIISMLLLLTLVLVSFGCAWMFYLSEVIVEDVDCGAPRPTHKLASADRWRIEI